jgi:hypothetical protein
MSAEWAARNRAIKKLLEEQYGKGKVRIKGTHDGYTISRRSSPSCGMPVFKISASESLDQRKTSDQSLTPGCRSAPAGRAAASSRRLAMKDGVQ